VPQAAEAEPVHAAVWVECPVALAADHLLSSSTRQPTPTQPSNTTASEGASGVTVAWEDSVALADKEVAVDLEDSQRHGPDLPLEREATVELEAPAVAAVVAAEVRPSGSSRLE